MQSYIICIVLYSDFIFARISSSAGQNSYLSISSAVIHFASTCSSSFISCPSSSSASNRLNTIVMSGYSCTTLTNRLPTVISTSSSSLHSLLRASLWLSPFSTFPPTNSQSKARALSLGRWHIRNLSSLFISAATTSVIPRLVSESRSFCAVRSHIPNNYTIYKTRFQ